MKSQCAISLLCVAFSLSQPSAGKAQPGTLRWAFNAPTPVTSAVALATDETIYLGTATALYAITNAGSNRWTFPIGVVQSPAVASDGTIYFGDQNANFYAIDPAGSQKWLYPVQSEFPFLVYYVSSPAISSDGTVYLVAGGHIFALSANGLRKWKYAIDETSNQDPLSPVVGADGTIYVGSGSLRTLYALNADGTERWKLNLGRPTGESAAIGADGTVFISGNGLSLTGYGFFAVLPSGVKLWETAGSLRFGGSPSIGGDGTIYEGNCESMSLWALGSGGETKWNAVGVPAVYPPYTTTAAVDARGTIYYCNSNAVWALNAQGAPQWVYRVAYPGVLRPTVISPTIGPDGTLYASFGCTLYAITGGVGPGQTPWPMYRQNARHTGKIERPTLKQPQKQADSGFQFQLYPNELGLTYVIESSTNLNAWTSLTSFVATTFPMPVVDVGASNAPARFYRASSP